MTSLELFFDLVFVLAVTQCTAAMAHDPSWTGMLEALAVLGVLWWSWGGYAWLTSALEPDEGAVRLVMFGAMAAALVASLCVTEAFGDHGVAFAVAYGALRAAHLALFVVAGRDAPLLRRSVGSLAVSSAIALALLLAAGFTDGWVQGALWIVAIVGDVGGPYLFGAEGWQIVAEHFAERFGLFVIIALGESVVAIGVGAEDHVDAGVVVAAVLGMAILAALWWLYFDLTALIATDRLVALPPGRAQNELARDGWALLHFPMVAGIVLVAFGLERTLAHVDEPLHAIPATALLGGAALYLLAHVAFRLRVVGTLNVERLLAGLVLVALIAPAARLDAVVGALVVAAACWAVVGFEVRHFAELRQQVRHAPER